MATMEYETIYSDFVQYIDREITKGRIDAAYRDKFIPLIEIVSESMVKHKLKKNMNTNLYHIIITELIESVILEEPKAIISTNIHFELIDKIVYKLSAVPPADDAAVIQAVDNNKLHSFKYIYACGLVTQYVSKIHETVGKIVINQKMVTNATEYLYTTLDRDGAFKHDLTSANTIVVAFKLIELILLYLISNSGKTSYLYYQK